jgi:dihydroxyacid dehydratase/phosphogluconate dehydratase
MEKKPKKDGKTTPSLRIGAVSVALPAFMRFGGPTLSGKYGGTSARAPTSGRGRRSCAPAGSGLPSSTRPHRACVARAGTA